MKRLLTVFMWIFIGFQVLSAQQKGNLLSDKGYVGNVGASVSAGLGIGADLFTSHGYTFGNGLWLGGGTGLSFPSPYDLFLPLYSEAKYSFLVDKKVSPFLSAKVGLMTNFEDFLMIANPSVGLDLSRFSIFVTANLGLVSMRTYGLGVSWNFGNLSQY